METALSYAKDVSKTRLLAEGWIPDTVGKFDDFPVEDGGENVGFKAPQAPFKSQGLSPYTVVLNWISGIRI